MLGALQVARLVKFIFQDKVDVATRLDGILDLVGEFGEKVGWGFVQDCVNCIKAKSVEMIFG